MNRTFTRIGVVFCCALMIPALCFSQAVKGFDVRAARWGMTKQEVVKSESGNKPVRDAEGNLIFSGIEVAKCHVLVEYKFAAEKLSEVLYLVKA
ncbi:hypothetical protein [Spirosoma sp. KNUC1025]|uniref:hypothetical protein n=1 Tax=Spirosoma sp. KNUC1025 TaxID=2894082 RepID=UPI00386CDE35|nr:hypothetical protein LN737_15220 [Spirosoma sp. KNUC1025]